MIISEAADIFQQILYNKKKKGLKSYKELKKHFK